MKEGDDFASDTPFCIGKIRVPGFAKFFNSWKKGGIFIFNCIFLNASKGSQNVLNLILAVNFQLKSSTNIDSPPK